MKLRVDSVNVIPHRSNQIEVEIEGVSASEIADQIGLGELLDASSMRHVIAHYGEAEILEFIGRADVIAHFGITEAEEL